MLAGVLAVVAVALAVAIAVSSHGTPASKPVSRSANATALAGVESLLSGIPQSGMTLGNANAPVTITEYSDLVCPACDTFAEGSERQLIAQEVATGHVKLVSRGLETASSIANAGEYTTSQVAIRSAGLQGRAWDYMLLAYAEQPQTIGGRSAEEVPYVTSGYLQDLASQLPHLNLLQWQSGLTNSSLQAAVTADGRAAHAAGVDSTPALVISGASQTVRVMGAAPLAQIQAAIRQASGT